MKEFIKTTTTAETAVLVALITKQQNERKTEEYLDELEFLAETAGATTVRRFTQRMDGPSSVTYVGKGKLQEIRQYIEECEQAADEADDDPLTGAREERMLAELFTLIDVGDMDFDGGGSDSSERIG